MGIRVALRTLFLTAMLASTAKIRFPGYPEERSNRTNDTIRAAIQSLVQSLIHPVRSTPVQTRNCLGQEEKRNSVIQSIKKISNLILQATNGPVGQIVDLCYDHDWRLQYVVIDADAWMPGCRLRISPQPLIHGVVGDTTLAVMATREELLSRWVRGTPDNYNRFAD